jgi:aromatic-L-amino-acid decarboxylase
MDTGVQLGRRFRALKLWMILRAYGARGIRDLLSHHISLAQSVAGWVDEHPDFERLAPVPLSVVCFRWKPSARHSNEADLDAANQRIADEVNQTGDVFVSTARVREHVVIRIAIGHLRTSEAHVRRAWDLIVRSAATA